MRGGKKLWALGDAHPVENDDQNIGDNNNILHNDENQNLQEMPPQNGVLWSQL